MFSKNSHVLLCVLKASSGFYLKTVGCPLSCNGLLHESGQSQKAALRWSPVGDDEETHTHTHMHIHFPTLMWSLAGNSHFPECSHLSFGILPHPWFIANKSQRERHTQKEWDRVRKGGKKTDIKSKGKGRINQEWSTLETGKQKRGKTRCVLVNSTQGRSSDRQLWLSAIWNSDVLLKKTATQMPWKTPLLNGYALFHGYWSNSKQRQEEEDRFRRREK